MALGGPELAFALAAIAAALAVPCLLRLTPDERPVYIGRPKLRQAIDQTSEGARALLAHPGLRLLGTTLTVLLFFEGMADVLAVVVVLDLLGLGEGAVGYMNASWGIGALLAGGALAVMIHRSQLSLAIGGGSALAGAGAALVAGWPVAAAAFIAWFAFGAGYTFVEVAAKTFSQRLGTDEQLARVFGFLETARLTAMALGSIVAPLLVALVGARGAVLAAGALLAAFALTRWVALKSFETGAPVDPDRFSLLRENEIFRPLPVDTLERLCHDLEPVQFEAAPMSSPKAQPASASI